MKLKFTLTLWPTLGTLLALSLLWGLGTWQWQRYQGKLHLEAARDAQQHKAPKALQDVRALTTEDFAYSAVQVQGQFDNAKSVLFRHRQHDSHPGYWVGTPLMLKGGAQALVVNRGWVPRERAEAFIQDLMKQPATPQTYQGVVHIPERIIKDSTTRSKIKRGELALHRGGLKLASYDLELIQAQLDDGVAVPSPPAVLVLAPKHSVDPFPIASLDYITKPYMTSERHLSYSVFWYVMGIVLVGLYLGYSFGVVRSGRRMKSGLRKSAGVKDAEGVETQGRA